MVHNKFARFVVGGVLFLLLAIGLSALVGIGIVAGYEWRYHDRVYEGVHTEGVPLGGLTVDEAAAAIRNALTPYPGASVTLRYDAQTWELAPADLGLDVNAAATAAAAFAVGRRESVLTYESSLLDLLTDLTSDLLDQWYAFNVGVGIEPILRVDDARLSERIRAIAADVDLAAQEGRIDIVGLKATGVSGRPGRQVNFNATRTALLELMAAGKGGSAPLVVRELRPTVMSVDDALQRAQALAERRLVLVAETLDGRQEYGAVAATEQITLPVTLLEPPVDTNRIAEMGIVELVSEGVSSFRGSPPERVHNIVTAADKFQHVVVPPGGTFSFNQNVGNVSAAEGFMDALVIAGDRTAVGIGGGVCQVSTTVYRAAFFGGFPIVERHAHGYVVGWYGEPGMDASIFTPSVDFRFRNDTEHYLLIKSFVDTARGQLTFRIYGTKPGRTVEMVRQPATNVQPPPPALYQEDAKLAKGQIKQVDWAVKGMDVVIKRVIRFADGAVKEENIVSKYQPWRAIYLYGPGTPVPGKTSTAATP
ncbi:MAG: Vancomycin B-type resistance protein VanW [Chloroflexi bacterium ADurb.Bin325]|nr:MAG: Vancomycin B-type resistance protein VanW [Chloroflexi bacterium ADurb.Bin325]